MCAACGVATHVPSLSTRSAPGATRFAALRNADCRDYLVGASLSMMGDSIEHVISYWVMFQQFHSPALAGFAVISHWAPSLLSVYTGAWADRYDCRKIILLAQALFMTASAGWGILFLTGGLQMWHAMLLLVIHGLANVVWAPAEQLMLHDLAGREQLPSAIRLNSTMRSGGFLAGPAIGSLLLLALGPAFGIFANVLIYLPLTVWLLRTKWTGHVRDGGESRSRVSPAEAVRVLREVVGQPVVISMVMLGGASSLLIGSGMSPQMPEYAADLGVDEAGLIYGALVAANAAGAVLGGILLESTHILRPSVRGAMVSAIVWALCLIGFALSSSYLLSLMLLMVAGAANLTSTSMSQTLVQLLAPPDKRGRVIGVYQMASAGLRAGSGFTIGLLGGVIGIHWSLLLSAVTLTGVVVWLMIKTQRAQATQAQAEPAPAGAAS